MVEYPWLVNIHNEHAGKTVEASIVPLDGPLAKNKIDTCWWSVVAKTDDAEDSEWKLADLVQRLRYRFEISCNAMVTGDGEVQAAVILSANGLTGLAVGGAILVQYLVAAPRNRNRLVAKPLYRFCGTQMVFFASCMSYALGFNGRINGFILPSAEPFYDSLGFVSTGFTNHEGLTLFELPAERALAWMAASGISE